MAPRNPIELAKYRSPTWLQGPAGQQFVSFLVQQQIDENALLKEGIKQRWPATCGDDALGLVGRDRGIEQAPGETLADYRVRLGTAPDLWTWCGTATGIRNLFAPLPGLGAPGVLADAVAVLGEHEEYFDDGDWYSRFWTIAQFGEWAADTAWDDPGDYDDGGVWDFDSTLAVETFAYLRRGYRVWKAPASYPVSIFVLVGKPSDELWGFPGDYDDGGDWGTEGEAVWARIIVGHLWHEEERVGGSVGAWDEDGTWEEWE